jgi:hypothetical protein
VIDSGVSESAPSPVRMTVWTKIAISMMTRIGIARASTTTVASCLGVRMKLVWPSSCGCASA